MTEEKMRRADAVKNFITYDEKPEECDSTEVAVTVYLMAIADAKGFCGAPRLVKIAMCTGGSTLNLKKTRAALVRLDRLGWITYKQAKIKGEPEPITVHFDKLPPNPQAQHIVVRGNEANQ